MEDPEDLTTAHAWPEVMSPEVTWLFPLLFFPYIFSRTYLIFFSHTFFFVLFSHTFSKVATFEIQHVAISQFIWGIWQQQQPYSQKYGEKIRGKKYEKKKYGKKKYRKKKYGKKGTGKKVRGKVTWLPVTSLPVKHAQWSDPLDPPQILLENLFYTT